MLTIYKIENTANGRVYIGSTSKKKPQYRWSAHLYDLRRGEHKNHKLQEDFNELGEEVFEFVPLFKVRNSARILEEQRLIEQLRAYYNIRLNKKERIL